MCALTLWNQPPNGIRLDFNLIPASATANLRTELSAEEWSRIRAWALASARYRCQTCGAGPPLEVHEQWQFDEATSVQRLASLQVLCEGCHGIVHAGRTIRIHGRVELNQLRRRWATVNQVPANTFDDAFRRARHIAHHRSRARWRLVVPELGIDRWAEPSRTWRHGQPLTKTEGTRRGVRRGSSATRWARRQACRSVRRLLWLFVVAAIAIWYVLHAPR